MRRSEQRTKYGGGAANPLAERWMADGLSWCGLGSSWLPDEEQTPGTWRLAAQHLACLQNVNVGGGQ